MTSPPSPPRTIRIGDLSIPGVVVQAALSGYSDLAMRTVAREHGAPYALNEVVLDKNVLEKGRLQRRILSVPEHDHPVGGQLMGDEPERFGAAARELVRAGYDVVDINFGCPVNKVLGRRRGGWLLRDPDTAIAILDAVLEAVSGDVPVTVKMRRGYDDSAEAERSFFTILDAAMERGVAAFTVHPRTVHQKYRGPSEWSFLADLKKRVGDFCLLGSGDLFSPFDIVAMLRTTGVDGVTAARGCIGNPFLFGQVETLLAGCPPLRPTCAEQRAAMHRHIELALALHGSEKRALGPVRLHLIKYAQYHREPVRARDRFVGIRRFGELLSAVDELFDDAFDFDRRELRPEDAVVPVISGCNGDS